MVVSAPILATRAGLPVYIPHLRLPLVQDLYIIQINGFSAFVDDAHKMIAARSAWVSDPPGREDRRSLVL